MRYLLSLALFSVLSVCGYSQDLARPIYDSELTSILQECQNLREQLKTSLDNLSKAEETQLGLLQTLSEKQARIDDLVNRSKSLADSLVSSEEALTTLKDQLEELRKLFEQYRSAVAWEQIKTAALWAAGGVVVGALAMLLAIK